MDASESVIEPRGDWCAAPFCVCVVSTGRCASYSAMEAVIDDIWDRTAVAVGLPSLVGLRDAA